MKLRYILSAFFLFSLAGGAYLWRSTIAQPAKAKPSSAKPVPAVSRSHVVPPQPLPEMSEPVEFVAPSLDIRAPIEKVGLTKDGDMDVPLSETALGWYKGGAFPGNAGPAVLAGHTGHPNKPAPFRKLERLKRGDHIQVQDSSGTRASFRVIEITVYTPESAPLKRIFGSTTTARLAIITCTGTWIPKTKTYSHRLVIYAVRTNDVS